MTQELHIYTTLAFNNYKRSFSVAILEWWLTALKAETAVVR